MTALQAKLRRRHAGGPGGDGQSLGHVQPPVVQRLEDHVEGHHLGKRGGIVPVVGIAREEHRARRGVHDDGGIAARLGHVRLRRGGAQNDEKRQERGRNAAR